MTYSKQNTDDDDKQTKLSILHKKRDAIYF